jgi:hypothetical protein
LAAAIKEDWLPSLKKGHLGNKELLDIENMAEINVTEGLEVNIKLRDLSLKRGTQSSC